MEYRRAATCKAPIAVVLLSVATASPEAMGRMSRLSQSMLRQGETLYRLSESTIAIVLPGSTLAGGQFLAGHMESLCGVAPRDIEIRITAYPEDAANLMELEAILRRKGFRDIHTKETAREPGAAPDFGGNTHSTPSRKLPS